MSQEGAKSTAYIGIGMLGFAIITGIIGLSMTTAGPIEGEASSDEADDQCFRFMMGIFLLFFAAGVGLSGLVTMTTGAIIFVSSPAQQPAIIQYTQVEPMQQPLVRVAKSAKNEVVVECPHCEDDLVIDATDSGIFACPICDGEFEY
ncbi:MAG: hypothetical protein QF440_06440 [Candidatus Thalassarchaeaceae archaeon]|jgi:hypothetical protein|nr:hypothetical protein [Candidatus Thalassarchaeaceae archaeon]